MNNFLWFDCETTGLDPAIHQMLEIGVVAGEETKSWLIKPYGKHALERLSPFVKEMHTKSGLLEELRAGKGTTLIDVEIQLVAFVKEHFTKKPILAGSSIHFDRAFIKLHLPSFEQCLHYRMLDVSSFMVYYDSLGVPRPPSAEGSPIHRTLRDIARSASMLHYYTNPQPHAASKER